MVRKYDSAAIFVVWYTQMKIKMNLCYAKRARSFLTNDRWIFESIYFILFHRSIFSKKTDHHKTKLLHLSYLLKALYLLQILCIRWFNLYF